MVYDVFISPFVENVLQIWYHYFPVKLSRKHSYILNKHHYYTQLSDSNKKRFNYRLLTFMKSRNFIKKDARVSDDMKVLISAAAVQLTLGLDKYKLKSFRRIIIYEDSFDSSTPDRKHIGEVKKRRGEIALSWKHFLEGYAIVDDGKNVGLHELAHALEHQTFIDGMDEVFHDYYPDWKKLAYHKMLLIRRRRNKFLRNYGGTNLNEMFAVCIESFFERPHDFAESLPLLYEVLTCMIKQDPRNPQDPIIYVEPKIDPRYH